MKHEKSRAYDKDSETGLPAEKVETFDSLAARIVHQPTDARVRLVAVDGAGGAGKSTFAARLAKALGGAPVIHTDDFSTGEPGVEWWPRFDGEVVVPLSEGRPARYRRYDWPTRRLAEWHTVEPAPVVILEGVSSARAAVRDVLAFAIWVDAPEDIRLARGLERDGEEARPLWRRWMAQEDTHFAKDDTRPRCDLIVDGNPDVRHDKETEFVARSGMVA
jgi:Phosphoribulokinase / Uridine kinase family